MLAQFPKEQETKREALLARVESIAPTLQASGVKSEELATLAPEAVTALRDNGLFKLKLPAVVGGAEADPVTEMRVLEEIAFHDFTSGWCTMVGATAVGSLAAFLPQLDWSASSPADISQPRPFPSSQPAARCVRTADTGSVVVGVSIVAFATPNGCSAEPLLRALK